MDEPNKEEEEGFVSRHRQLNCLLVGGAVSARSCEVGAGAASHSVCLHEVDVEMVLHSTGKGGAG